MRATFLIWALSGALVVPAAFAADGAAAGSVRERTEQAVRARSAREAIQAANREFERAHLRGDAAAIAAQYTEDAQILWEDRPLISGRAKIEAEWRKDMGGPGRPAKITSVEIEQSGDLAYEVGTMLITSPEGTVIYDGKYICIWKRVDGQWRIHRDIGNKNKPPAEAH